MSFRPITAHPDPVVQLQEARDHAAALAEYLAGALQGLKRRDPTCRTDLADVALSEYRVWRESANNPVAEPMRASQW